MIPVLINKQDGFEVVRDSVAAILVEEVASQMALATAGGEDPNDWKLRIFSERSNPWEQFLYDPTDLTPIVNVWFDTSSFPRRKGNVVKRQTAESTFNVDCYGYSESADSPAGGHTPGDKGAALEAHRALRLVRNILMSSEYVVLGLKGIVGARWTEQRTVFQPAQNDRPVQQIVGARLVLQVDHLELSPSGDESTTVGSIGVDIDRQSDGMLVAQAEYEYEV